MARPITFGEIEGIEEGHWFADRKEMMPSCFHRNSGWGVDGNGKEGAAAIALSGGYEDDEDHGDEIIYTGAGGNDPDTKRQVKDQSWEHPSNAGLLTSWDQGLPVRVARGHNHKSSSSPEKGYSYAGLYCVVDAWEELGKSGFKICRFRLIYCGSNSDRKTPEKTEIAGSPATPERREGTVMRIVRDTEISLEIKRLYKNHCQVCCIAIPTKTGSYSEGAHIRPLGRPHNGDDSKDNLLCLCPNHHVMLDRGSFSIDDDFSLLGPISGKLRVNPHHDINEDNLKYHRQIHGYEK
ncbi:YDG/SRA domain-containing protein [Ferrimonas gelatinilytica]|uniref:HNH endonuclease n=1 Tax=Ferrimonas gelatinilytica TaxID=1255257 RepID=A0ABP9S0Y3_9GAMM